MMNCRRAMVLGLCGLGSLYLVANTRTVVAGGDHADEEISTIHPEATRANMRFLADDLLEGRGTATRGHELAAKFMATRFEALGMGPAGDVE
jgi:hypothetical protein